MWFILWIKLVTKRPDRLRALVTVDVWSPRIDFDGLPDSFLFLVFSRKDRGGGNLQDVDWTLLVVSMPLLSLLVIETCYSEEWLLNLLAAGFLQLYAVTLKLDLKSIPPHINKALLASPQRRKFPMGTLPDIIILRFCFISNYCFYNYCILFLWTMFVFF